MKLELPRNQHAGDRCGRRRRRPPKARLLVDGAVPRGHYGFPIPTRACQACRRRSPREDDRSHWKSRHITAIRPTPNITSNRTTFTIATAPSEIESPNHTTQDRILRRAPDAHVTEAALRQRSRHGSIGLPIRASPTSSTIRLRLAPQPQYPGLARLRMRGQTTTQRTRKTRLSPAAIQSFRSKILHV